MADGVSAHGMGDANNDVLISLVLPELAKVDKPNRISLTKSSDMSPSNPLFQHKTLPANFSVQNDVAQAANCVAAL